jgi:hypothetical protein
MSADVAANCPRGSAMAAGFVDDDTGGAVGGGASALGGVESGDVDELKEGRRAASAAACWIDAAAPMRADSRNCAARVGVGVGVGGAEAESEAGKVANAKVEAETEAEAEETVTFASRMRARDSA